MVIVFHLPKLTLGGVEMNAIKLAKEYLKMGHSVKFLVHSFSGEYCVDIPKEIEIVDLETRNIFIAVPKLKKWFRNNKIDILISSRDLYNSVLLWIKHRYKFDFYLIASCHTNAVIEHQLFKNKMRRLKTYLYMKMAKCTYRYADEIVAVSKGVAESITEYTKIPASKISVIYNPIIDDQFELKKTESLNGDDCFNVEGPIVLAAGRLTEQKNFGLLINAFSIVVKKIPNAKLFIFGRGEENDALNNLIKQDGLEKNVFIHDFVSNLLKYMIRSDLFALSSNWEGFGNVLAEAMGCGVPLVSTDCPSGPREILEDGKYGILVDTNNPDSLANAIVEQLINPYPAKDVLMEKSKDFNVETIAIQYLKGFKDKHEGI